MSRSLKKGPFVDAKLLEKVEKMTGTTGARRPIKTWSRRSMITPDFVGHTFLVHNGKIFNSVFVTENMVGHKLGALSPTRIFKKHASHAAKVPKQQRPQAGMQQVEPKKAPTRRSGAAGAVAAILAVL